VTEGVQWILYAVVFQQPQHAITIGRASDIHRLFGQFIHGGEIARQPMSVGEVETIAPGLEKGLTRFSTKAERHIIALGITTASRDRHTLKQKDRNEKVYYDESSCMKHPSPPPDLTHPSGMAQRLHKSIPQPRRHLPLPIERDQENMPWQNRTIPTITRCSKNIQ
jgi:hypothetical protein